MLMVRGVATGSGVAVVAVGWWMKSVRKASEDTANTVKSHPCHAVLNTRLRSETFNVYTESPSPD